MKTFHLPDLGEGLAEAEVREWYIKEGDQVKVDQPLVSMETAKAVVDVPSPYEGKIVKLHGNVNDIIKTGAAFITFEVEGEAKDKPKGSVVGALEESSSKWAEGDVIIGGAAKTKSTQIKAMPAARVLAKELNVDLTKVTATGPQGLITPDDVKKHVGGVAVSKSSVERIEGAEALHGFRRVMANIMATSNREIAATTIIEDADITHLAPKADLTVLLLRAMVAATKVEPALNAWFDGDASERKIFKELNIGLAVDTPEGLFVPVIKDVESASDQDLRERIEYLKKATRDRSLPQSEMQGATITLSNFGAITGRYATPIIVPPMVAILASGRSREVPVVRDGKVVAGKILPLSLTFDHRAVTGGEATRFLGTVIKELQK